MDREGDYNDVLILILGVFTMQMISTIILHQSIIYTATPNAKRTNYDVDQVMGIFMPDVKQFQMHYTDFRMSYIYAAQKVFKYGVFLVWITS